MDATTYLLLGVMLVLVFGGVEIAVCFGTVSFLALYLTTGGDLEVTLNFLSSTAYEALRDYIFAVVPLFLLMGEFIARSGVAADLYWAIDRWLLSMRRDRAGARLLCLAKLRRFTMSPSQTRHWVAGLWALRI